jgi:hypothetical protein
VFPKSDPGNEIILFRSQDSSFFASLDDPQELICFAEIRAAVYGFMETSLGIGLDACGPSWTGKSKIVDLPRQYGMTGSDLQRS